MSDVDLCAVCYGGTRSDRSSDGFDVYIGNTYMGGFTGNYQSGGYVNNVNVFLMEYAQRVSGVDVEIKEYSYTRSVDKIINKLQANE